MYLMNYSVILPAPLGVARDGWDRYGQLWYGP